MSMKEQILSIAMQDPRFQETITVVEQQLSGTNIVAEDLSEAIQMLEYVVQNPNTYQEVRMAAIKDGLIDEDMFPPQYDEVLIISLLVVLYGMQDRLSQQGYARGGLKVSGKQLAHRGQGGDRHLAHINDREAEVLRRMGGQGTVNPNTGLREYKGLKNILKIALPIALTFVAGPMGTALGTSLTAGTALASYAPVIGGALVGAGSSALQGLVSGQGLDLKNIGLGAVSGGIGGLAPGITDSLAQQFPNLSEGAIRAIAGGTAGALGSAVTGSDFGEGIVRGAIGQLAMPAVQDMTKRASEALFGGVQAAATPTGVGGGTMKPTPVSKTDIVFEEGQFGGKTPFKSAVLDSVQEMPIPTDESIFASQFVEGPTSQTDLPALDQALIRTGLYDKATIAEDFTNIPKLATEPKMPVDVGSNVDPYNTDAQLANNQGMLSNLLPEGVAKLLPDLSMTELGIGALGLAALSGLSEQDQMAISRAESSGIFDQTTSQYDFVKMRGEANQRGMTLTQFLGSPFFRNDQSKYYLNDTMMAARGGIMDAPGYVNGPGNGRDDVINARLSNGEYVIDAESVAMLGDGSNTAGAEMLDDMRKKLRMHKGKVLAKGEFSPDAKSPLEYMRRSA
jgi:hypothetical protein